MKKVICVFILIGLVFSMSLIFRASNVMADVTNVEVSPNSVNSVAQYNIYVVLHKGLGRGENLYIKFPPQCVLPSSINKEFITIDGTNPLEAVVSDKTVILTLGKSILIDQGIGSGGIIVSFSSSAGIKNPSTPDLYTIEVWSEREQTHSVYSFYIGVQSQGSTVSLIKVTLSDDKAGKNSQYDIIFTVSMEGSLSQGDYVDVFFPKGTVIPFVPDPSKVLLNFGNCTDVLVSDKYVRVYVPEGWFVGPGSQCEIIFLKEFGIINPELTGNFAVQVATSKDAGLSKPYFYNISGTSVSYLSVIVVPSSQKMNAAYTIQIRTSETADKLVHDVSKINIKFDDAFSMPNFIRPDAITVNNVSCSAVSLNGNLITLITPVDVSTNSLVTIFIKKDFGILNPANVGDYSIFVNTSADAAYVSTNISITPSTISKPQVIISNASAGQVSAYTISFSTGVSGNMAPGNDKISVILPPGTKVPSTISNTSILVNGIPTTLVEVYGTTINITIPIEIKENSIINLLISDSAGIKNPTQVGNYKIYVYTTKELTPVESELYSIKNVPQTNLLISPAAPDGQNGFYKTKPAITLSSISAVDPNPTIYYYFDNNQPVIYSGTIIVPEGVHTFYYYAIDKEGDKEDVRSVQLKVDTVPPVITIISPQGNSVLSSKSITIKGYVDPGSTILLDGKSVTVDGAGNFEAGVEISTSPQTIRIDATDIAGNTAQKTLILYLDLTPPPLSITKPVMFQQVSKLPLLVEGKTEKGAKVTVNGEVAEVKDDGSFSFALSTLPEGELSKIEVVATDSAGNSTRQVVSVKYSKTTIIRLQVGNKTALINDSTYTLEASPTIVSGRTMVPFRFIGEAFGATFNYDSIFKIVEINFNGQEIKMQIGIKTAFVNGKATSLEVAPYIVNGRTLVPIRFISEVFGADVSWDGTTKTVTIIYPKA